MRLLPKEFVTYIAGMVLSAGMLTSCGEDGVDGPVDMTCTDIVTFIGNKDGRATFVFRKVDDSPEITLTSQAAIDTTDVAPGARVLLRYIPDNNLPYTSGPITMLGGSLISLSLIDTEWHNAYDQWDKDKVYVYSIWRSGSYINTHIRLTYTSEPRVFCMAADPATIDSAWPDVYLVHIIPGENDNHDRAYYASFDIGELWSRSTVEGIRLHVANSNLDKQIFTFTKHE